MSHCADFFWGEGNAGATEFWCAVMFLSAAVHVFNPVNSYFAGIPEEKPAVLPETSFLHRAWTQAKENGCLAQSYR